jgi:hypothetical protein
MHIVFSIEVSLDALIMTRIGGNPGWCHRWCGDYRILKTFSFRALMTIILIFLYIVALLGLKEGRKRKTKGEIERTALTVFRIDTKK